MLLDLGRVGVGTHGTQDGGCNFEVNKGGQVMRRVTQARQQPDPQDVVFHWELDGRK